MFLARCLLRGLLRGLLLCFPLRFLRSVPLMLVCIALPSCITYVYPHGHWSEPLDLKLHSSSLEGLVIDVKCEKAKASSSSEESTRVGPCPMIRKSLRNLGAQVLGLNSEAQASRETNEQSLTQLSSGESSSSLDPSDETSNPPLASADITLIYRDALSQSGNCGWAWIPLLFSGGLYPCLAETRSLATLTVRTFSTNRSDSFPLKVSVRKYFGFGALGLLISDMGRPLSRSAYQREQGANLVKFIQNKVYTSAMVEGGAF